MELPASLGDYGRLLQALLHNPFLGSGHDGPPHHLHKRMPNPEPDPWRSESGPVSAAVAGFVSAAVAKATAGGLGDKGKEIKAAANASIAQLMDDYCGTPPKKWPWPWPGPPPWNWLIVSELTAVAQTF
jgi:hypothetical protein